MFLESEKNSDRHMSNIQESLFSKAYRPLAQQYFSAGLGWSLPLGGGVLFHHHFWGGGGPLPPLLEGGLLFHYHFWGVPVSSLRHSLSNSGGGGEGGSHVTYPIMLLYTAIECPSVSWAKFTWGPPPPLPPSLTDWKTNVWKHYLPAHYVCGR